MIFNEIPTERPQTPLLDQIKYPGDLRSKISRASLEQLANELRAYLLYTVGTTGGHFGAGLGVVELTLALHYVYNTPDDLLVWDVGHQAYPHKILTGRKEKMHTLRQAEGISAFPKREESDYDSFGVGHSSTSISAALGMAVAIKQMNQKRHTVAVIGDGAMTAGMAFEALNHAGDTRANVLVILNDNDMSISNNVGGLSRYFGRILSSKLYTTMREGSKKVLKRMPQIWEIARKTEEHMKGMVVPGTLFEELGFHYMGPVNGHDIEGLVKTLENAKTLEGPQFLHVITQKGKGFAPAEADPIGYHAITKLEPTKPTQAKPVKKLNKKYSNVFGDWLCDIAACDPKVIGITPAMKEGSDLIRFAKEYPDRYHDVAIAEQHAVTFAAGLACEGLKPVVAIYSTFLQRAYDQLIHDVAIQHLDVLFAIDRAGLVGEDGPTHAGSFDLSYMRCIPNMVIMAPSDENETRQMLYTGYKHPGPAAVRYPRGTGPGAPVEQAMTEIPIGKALKRRSGSQVALLAFGSMVAPSLQAAEQLNATVIDMRFIKPLDEALLQALVTNHQLLVTIEENTIAGGAGSSVLEYLAKSNRLSQVDFLQLGLPDAFIEQGAPKDLLATCGLDAKGICASVQTRLETKLAVVKSEKANP